MMKSKSLISPLGRVSYPYVFKPQDYDGNGIFKYQLTLLIDADDAGLKEMRALASAKAKEFWEGEVPKGIWNPFREGDESKPEEKGKIKINFKRDTKRKPGVLDTTGEVITEESDLFYGGCYARVSYSIYCYKKGSGGIGFGLNNVLKVRDGERFGSAVHGEEFNEFIMSAGTDEDLFS